MIRFSLVLMATAGLLTSCRSGDPRPVPAPKTIVTLPATVGTGESGPIQAQQVTAVGDNSEARFSADGGRMLFVSRARPTHRQAQIYEIDLTSLKERRLTYHDGDATGPVYSNDGKGILYASSTDEIKEEPEAIARVMRTYQPEKAKKKSADPQPLAGEVAELYSQSLADGEITRLTRATGFDGELDQDPKSKRLVFVSARSGAPQILVMQGNDSRKMTPGRWPRYSPDGKTLAYAFSDNATNSTGIALWEGDKQQILIRSTLVDMQPTWHPSGNEIVFSSNRGGKGFNLYSIDRKGTCLKRLTTAEFDQLHPVFSPDGKRLVFTGRLEGRTQIYMMDYQPPAVCQPL